MKKFIRYLADRIEYSFTLDLFTKIVGVLFFSWMLGALVALAIHTWRYLMN